MIARIDPLAGRLFVGLMSGTSIDGIDSAIIRSHEGKVSLVASRQHPIAEDVRAEIAALSQPAKNEIERMGRLDRQLGDLFADATLALLEEAGIEPSAITAIGSHGQTIRHAPPTAADDKRGFTVQIGDPNTIAERCGIATVADFRRRDIAAGGEGAPLAPAFHAAVFAHPGRSRAIVNIGGIANVTLLQGNDLRAGFDSGPGNTLLDHWHRRHTGKAFDRDGHFGAGGKVIPSLLEQLLQDPYFARTGPRSTGKERFHLAWLEERLTGFSKASAQDVQATLAELSAASIATAVLDLTANDLDEVYVCGGGAHNRDLMRRLKERLRPARVATTEELGIHPDWVEAAAFGWLAQQRLDGISGNAQVVTGATGLRVLGAVYPP